MDNNLGNIIKNDTARAVIYSAWVISGILIGAGQVAFTDPDPEWLTTTFNIWSYLGLFIGSLAVVNSKAVPVQYVSAQNVQTVQSENTTVVDSAPEDPSYG